MDTFDGPARPPHGAVGEDRAPGYDRFDLDAAPAKPWLVKLRNQAIPFPVAALLWGAADAAHAAPQTWPIGAPAAAAVYFVAAMATWTAWGNDHPENRAGRRRWATTVIAGGGTWLLWAATIGPTHLAALVLAAGGTAVMLPYWARNSPWKPRTPTAAVEAPEPPAAPTIETVTVHQSGTATQMFWDTVIAEQIPAARGTRLVDPEITDDYEQYVIQLVAGRQATESIRAALTLIASAFGRGLDTCSVLPHPTGVQDKAILRLATSNPLQVVRHYPGTAQAIDLTGGNIRVLVGYRGDGSGVWWTFYLKDFGALGGAVFGDTGSGKTELLINLITSAAYTGLIVPIVGCPQGKSYPVWRKYGHWPASTPAEVLEQARSLMAAHRTRAAINDLRGADFHVPTADAPVIEWVVDEFHTMRDTPEGPEFYELADALDRAGRATAIRLIAADQDPSAIATFGNKMTLRRSLLASQCVTLRLGSGVDTMIPGMKLNPTLLPQEFPDGSRAAGLAVVLGEAEPFRAVPVRNAATLAAAAPEMTIEKATAVRMGDGYLQRHTRKLVARADKAAELAEADPELLAEILAANPELAEALPAARAKRAGQASAARKQFQSPKSATVIEFSVPAAPKFELVTPPATWTCVECVHDLLRDGVTRFGDLMAKARRPTGQPYSETAIRNALAELINSGKARDSKWGHYEYVAA